MFDPQLSCALRGICAYRHIVDDPLISLVHSLLNAIQNRQAEDAVEAYSRLFFALRTGGWASLGQWLHDKLRYEDSPYARLVEAGAEDPALTAAARQDIQVFAHLAALECSAVLEQIGALEPGLSPVLEHFPRWSAEPPFSFDGLTAFYRSNGSGIFAKYRAFLWEDGKLLPVPNPDCPVPDEMLGYELQRRQVVSNTQAMLEGRPVNNVLLYGDSGTGKSATVKSLLHVEGFTDLRLIEVQKQGLAGLPALIRLLAGRRLKFILFIDDLAFDQDDRTYSALKTILEGGLEPRPANVAIYATSNRRHLVRQTFSDRAGDEVDAVETIQEKTSLSERFGLRIPYLTLSKAAFLEMVEQMAALHGVSLPAGTLQEEAVKWAARHPGRTPRTAKQFITSLTSSPPASPMHPVSAQGPDAK